ncbi:MAG: hypothetical protein HZA08_06440 [Nitrospirae bacterium]|nr:hypothetical protein [Nitrospirota bacterium]
MKPERCIEIIRLIENATNYDYSLRWVDEATSLGDFDGREVAIDVFNITASEQIVFLTRIRQIRNKMREMIGHRGVFIFHSPESTRMHYANLFPITHGVLLEAGSSIRMPLPVPGGTGIKPVISGGTICLKLRKAA